MLTPDGAVALIRRHQARLDQFTTGAERRVLGAWVATRGGTRFPGIAADVATALRTTVANQTAATLTMYVRLAEESPATVNAREIAGTVRGEPAAVTYRQPIVAARWAEQNPDRTRRSPDAVARDRIRELIATDTAITAHLVEQALVNQTVAVIGWRRVPNPGACPLCLSAAGDIYASERLRGIHEHCKCGTAPVTARFDPAPAVTATVATQFAAAGLPVRDDLHAEVADPILGVRLREA